MSGKPLPRMVNLGCGSRYHKDWINIDIVAHSPAVIQHDLRKGIPLEENSCAVVYHSNILEHVRREGAIPFMRECWRVLAPGGILRVATPDLERICRIYLEKLEALERGEKSAEPDYDWMLMEMYDQTVREKGGGGMVTFLRQNPLPNEEFVFNRIGLEGREIVESLRSSKPEPEGGRHSFRRVVRKPRLIFEWMGDVMLRVLRGGDAPDALRIGRFRLAGEVHQWMYDRHSLARLMRAAGFRDPRVAQPTESSIPNWALYHLDTLDDGSVIKPDSFFMEALKPA